MWYIAMGTSRQPVRFAGKRPTVQNLVTALGTLAAHRPTPVGH